jgi:hypothetical protein
MSADYGEKVSYLVLQPGTPVYTSDGEPVGTVKRVLAIPDEDIYDGLIVDTDAGERFVDGPHARDLYERAVVLDIAAEDIQHLPEPTPNPPALEVHPDDTVKHTFGEELGQTLRKAWDRISGNY